MVFGTQTTVAEILEKGADLQSRGQGVVLVPVGSSLGSVVAKPLHWDL